MTAKKAFITLYGKAGQQMPARKNAKPDSPQFRPLGFHTMEGVTEEDMEDLAAIGYQYVCFAALDWTNPQALKQTGALLKTWSNRLQPYAVHYPWLFDKPEFDIQEMSDKLTDWLRKTAALHIPWGTIHLQIYPKPELTSKPDQKILHDYEERVLKCFDKTLKRTRNLEVGLGIENGLWDCTGWNWLYNVEDALRIVKRLSAKNVGVCLDIGHAVIQGADPAAAIREIGKLLVDTHTNDTFGRVPNSHPWEYDVHIPVGVGIVHWIKVMEALDAIGFDRPICFETSPKFYPTWGNLPGCQLCYQNWRALEVIHWRWQNRIGKPMGG